MRPDGEDDADGDMRGQHGGAAVAEEGESDTDDGEESEAHTDVLYRLYDEHRGDADAYRCGVVFSRFSRDKEYPYYERRHQSEVDEAAEETELLGEDREEKVGLRLWDHFICRASRKARAEDAARGDRRFTFERLITEVERVDLRVEAA